MNTTLGNHSLLSFCDKPLLSNWTPIPNVVGPILRLPVNIYILQLVISRHLTTLKFYILVEAIFEIFISLYDTLGIIIFMCPNTYLGITRRFFLGFIVTGHPCLLTLLCVERFLAVVKPVVFLRLKPLKYKLFFSGIICLCTLFSCLGSVFLRSVFYYSLEVQIIMCCVVKLYSCIATLLALKQPGPGEGVGQRDGMSNIKLKAFKTILMITGSVIVMYVPLLFLIFFKDHLTQQQFQEMLNVCYTCTSFSGFFRALLILQRSGKWTSDMSP